jgi:hypothetical protein
MKIALIRGTLTVPARTAAAHAMRHVRERASHRSYNIWNNLWWTDALTHGHCTVQRASTLLPEACTGDSRYQEPLCSTFSARSTNERLSQALLGTCPRIKSTFLGISLHNDWYQVIFSFLVMRVGCTGAATVHVSQPVSTG